MYGILIVESCTTIDSTYEIISSSPFDLTLFSLLFTSVYPELAYLESPLISDYFPFIQNYPYERAVGWGIKM